MGWGLSPLQKGMLKRAYVNRLQGGYDPARQATAPPDLYTAEALADAYGCALPAWLTYDADGRRVVGLPRRQAHAAATASQHACVSRAGRRLFERKLFAWWPGGMGGWILTPAGLAAAAGCATRAAVRPTGGDGFAPTGVSLPALP